MHPQGTILSLSVVGVFLLAGGAVSAAPQGSDSSADHLDDRIFAVVDEDPILTSDIDRVIALGLVPQELDEEGQPLEEEEAYRRRALDAVIEQRLRFHAVEELGFEQISLTAVDQEIERLRAGFEDPEALDRRREEAGLTDQGLRQLLTRQLMVLTYIEERLGPRIFIRLEEIQAYYQDVLVPRLASTQGAEAPPMESVREQIREVLRQQRLNEEIVRWTEELRTQANVELYLDLPPGDLPPVVDVLP